MRDSLDQYFPIGICAYKPEKGLFVKLGPHRYIMVDFCEKSVRVKDGPYNLMLHCVYAAEDIRCDERVVQSGFELQRCQKYPGTDKEGFADFKPAEYLDGTKPCPYKHAEWKRE